MRETTIKLYQFDELTDKAKATAFDKWCESSDYPWRADNSAVLKAFEAAFPVCRVDYEYGTCGGHGSCRCTDDNASDLSGVRLMAHLWTHYKDVLFPLRTIYRRPLGRGGKTRKSKILRHSDCPLTGYYIDDETLAPIYSFLRAPDARTFEDLLSECVDAWATACAADMDGYYSMDTFTETARTNEYEYTEDGDQW